MKRALKDIVRTHLAKLGIAALILAVAISAAAAQKAYDRGVTDTEIKIGNIMPYSGPASPTASSARR